MKSADLRKKFLKFFEEKGHKIIPSASLVPFNDPTVLFTTAGMHPLVPYLLGERHSEGKRLVNYQKCLRTDDIDEVGDAVHNTFFEMLGNWSLGDYWKKEAITWSYEFLTDKKWLGINPAKLAVTVFVGDVDASKDEESAEVWKSLGIPEDRIAYLGKKDNWWGPPGVAGPCGPDTEMFYWVGGEKPPTKFDPSDKNWVEIWNNVFMQYEKTINGEFVPLKQKNVDTGMGMERMCAVLQNKDNIYDTDLFAPILEKIALLSDEFDLKAKRIIADHLRAATFLIADGVTPSNKDRGYILRRLIRRAVTYAKKAGIENEFSTEIGAVVIKHYEEFYPELKHHQKIFEELNKEETNFRAKLEEGLRYLNKTMHNLGKPYVATMRGSDSQVTGSEWTAEELGRLAFDLFQNYGFPPEFSFEEIEGYFSKLQGYDFSLDNIKSSYKEEFKKHQELSRTASVGMFKGGLADHSEKVVRLHTATHLLDAALRKVLGEGVWQKGSNITEERTRFDFTYDKKMTDEEKKQVEDLVNAWIQRDLTVKKEILPLEEAKKLGAIGVFGAKYPDSVSIYTIFDPKSDEVVSREFCGGPHVGHTSVIGKLKIIKEESASAGVRRIKAVIG